VVECHQSDRDSARATEVRAEAVGFSVSSTPAWYMNNTVTLPKNEHSKVNEKWGSAPGKMWSQAWPSRLNRLWVLAHTPRFRFRTELRIKVASTTQRWGLMTRAKSAMAWCRYSVPWWKVFSRGSQEQPPLFRRGIQKKIIF